MNYEREVKIMREILFRGKTDKGERVYGDLLHPDLYGNGYSIEDFTKEKNNCFDVIPETIGQYTGLTDKNGTKIFEGDIVSMLGELKGIYTCVWEEHNFEHEFDNKTMSFGLACVHSDDIKVIGNTHDNPELLKEREG